jgi:pimeloyl-ACP methyl ester carboxylesterase
MTTFVLVHGAFGSSAELAPVIPELEAFGHRAIAVDLPCTDAAAMLDDYARTVVEAMAGIEGPVVVVGHSAGGATISLVPARTRVATGGAGGVSRLSQSYAAPPGLGSVGAALAQPRASRCAPHLRALHGGPDHPTREAARDGGAPRRRANRDRRRTCGVHLPAPRARHVVGSAGSIHVSPEDSAARALCVRHCPTRRCGGPNSSATDLPGR